MKRGNVGAVLLLLDGDIEEVGGKTFCAVDVAKSLASEAKLVGAGATFSVAVVFAKEEFETWLIASAESLAGKRLPDGRAIKTNAKAPPGDLEETARDAKRWLNKVVEGGYKPTRDQAELTDLLDLEAVRNRNLRSFWRLESALSELVSAIRNDKNVVTPS